MCVCVFMWIPVHVLVCGSYRTTSGVILRDVTYILWFWISNHQLGSNVRSALENPVSASQHGDDKCAVPWLWRWNSGLCVCEVNASSVELCLQHTSANVIRALTPYPSPVLDKCIPYLESQCWHASGTHWVRDGHMHIIWVLLGVKAVALPVSFLQRKVWGLKGQQQSPEPMKRTRLWMPVLREPKQPDP